MEELARSFYDLFRGSDRSHGAYVIAPATGRSAAERKVQGKAHTVRSPVTVPLWRDHLDGKKGLGVAPILEEGLCNFAAIDVDDYSLDPIALARRVEEAKLPLVTCRTKSGGAHLYVFLKEPTSAAEVRVALMEWTIALGHPKCEIFPKQEALADDADLGNWINMPYFGGDRTTRYAIKEGRSLSTVEFLEHARALTTDLAGIKAARVPEDESLRGAPPCLQHLARSGFPPGTRNGGLLNLGIYAKKRFGDQWEQHVDQYNARLMSPSLPTSEVRTVAGSLKKRNYVYTCKQEPIASCCNRAICLKREFGIRGSKGDPGVSFGNLRKILTEPPSWIIGVDGRDVRLDSTEDLISQPRFAARCVEAINVLPKKTDGDAWHEIVTELLAQVEEIAAPEDASTSGQFLALVEKFTTGDGRAEGRDPAEVFAGKPFVQDGFVFFRSSDLFAFLERRRIRVNPREAWVWLRDAKGKTEQFRVRGRNVRCWAIPWNGRAQDVALEVPEIEGETAF